MSWLDYKLSFCVFEFKRGRGLCVLKMNQTQVCCLCHFFKNNLFKLIKKFCRRSRNRPACRAKFGATCATNKYGIKHFPLIEGDKRFKLFKFTKVNKEEINQQQVN